MVYNPALDGLRALAVIAVVAYHFGYTSGGFLGVEVFFAISGYLITALLVSEHSRTSRIDLKDFWVRRIRRLMPALGFAVVGVSVLTGLVGEFAFLYDDLLGAVTYSTNWVLIGKDVSYFSSFERPSPLLHLWSLAIEEQFYLVWPVFIAVTLQRFRHSSVALMCVGGAVASTLLMALLYVPFTDPSRLYYGTDTRASGLLIGAAAAFLPKREIPGVVGGWAALGLAALALFISANSPWLFKGGFAVTAVFTCLVILATEYDNFLRKVLSLPLLVWVGVRSYSLYLWHWPVTVFTRAGIDTTLEGLPLLALRCILTVALAELSYTYIEKPLRRKRNTYA